MTATRREWQRRLRVFLRNRVAVGGFALALMVTALAPYMRVYHARHAIGAVAFLAGAAVVVDVVRFGAGIDGLGYLNLFFVWLFYVALGTGLRLGELRALLWRDVDRERRLIRVERAYSRQALRRPKTESGLRSVPLFPSVDAALRELPAVRVCELGGEHDQKQDHAEGPRARGRARRGRRRERDFRRGTASRRKVAGGRLRLTLICVLNCS